MLSGAQLDGLPELLQGLADGETSDNRAERSRLAALLRVLLREELTPLQRRVVLGLFLEGKSQRQLARELGVQPAAISRVKARATKRLHQCVWYYECGRRGRLP